MRRQRCVHFRTSQWGWAKMQCLVQALLAKNARVYLACRSQEKAEAAIENLKMETGKEALFLRLDLADIAGIRKSAAEFKGLVSPGRLRKGSNSEMYHAGRKTNFIYFSTLRMSLVSFYLRLASYVSQRSLDAAHRTYY
jgi:NAD(P)-dependent dehydrogenase (short-subunit alcohol dehydrogenase family)